MSDRPTMNGKPVFTVPAKTIINFKSGFGHKLLCDDMTFTAGDACQYSCSFCFVEAMQTKRRQWFADHGVQGEHFDHVIRRENAVEIARKQIMSKPEVFRQKKLVIYASPNVDVAANMELVRETVEICKVILELTNWDIRLLSKSNLLPKIALALDEWNCGGPATDYHKRPSLRVIYGVSTGTLDDKLAKAFEEGTPLVSKRIESLHWLQDNGFRTFGMICPSLPQWNYSQFAREMYHQLRGERLEHCWAEVINVRGDSFIRTEKCLSEAGYSGEAAALRSVSHDKRTWEAYARDTFDAHARVWSPKQLRFLQYVDNSNRDWWKAREKDGVVLL